MSWRAKVGGAMRLVQVEIESRVFRYTLAPVAVGTALLFAVLLHPSIPQSPEFLFLAAIVGTAWFGRRGPGLLAAILALLTCDYFFLTPLYSLAMDRESRLWIVPCLLGAFGAVWVTSTLSRTNEVRALLRQSEEKFRRILTNQPDVAITTDQNGRVSYVSPKIRDWTGFSSQEICAGGLPFLLERIHADDRSSFQQAMDGFFSLGVQFDAEFRFQCRDGNWRWLHNRAVASYRHNGVIFTDGVISDISRRKWSERELHSKTAFLEAQANATIDGILVVDANDRRLLHNRRVVQMFAIPAELLENPEQLPVRQHMLSQVRDAGESLARFSRFSGNIEETARDEVELTNGTVLDVYSSPVWGLAGEYYGRIWTFRDITQWKLFEDTLRQLSAAVEQSPVSVVITDPQSRITYVNRKFTEATGYTLAEVSGRNPRVLNSGYSPPEMFETLWTTILAGREWRGEFRNRRKNGELYWESAVISPIMDERGAISHFLAVKEDITERRALESELRQAQKLEGIGQLAAGIAHEINTPTQFVADNLTFLQESWGETFRLLELYRKTVRENSGRLASDQLAVLAEAEQACDLDFISREAPHAIQQGLEGARRVAKIVQAMKEFSHPDLADQTEADLNQGIRSTITVARSEWKHVAEVVTELDAALPPVRCYAGDVNQVILNLIVNAAHAIKEKLHGDGMGKITVRTRRVGAFAEIAVSDTGTGIPEEIRTRIFEPFFTTKEVGSGTGQGLALAHTVVVKKHRGKIWFESEVGRGTAFFVHLPFDPLPERQEGES